MCCNGEDLEVTQELLGSLATTSNVNSDDTAGTVWQVLLSQLVVFITWKTRIAYVRNLRVIYKRLGNCLAILAMLSHTNMQGLKAKVEIESALWRLNRTKVTHKLNGCLSNKSAAVTKGICIHKVVIGRVRLCQAWELICVSSPVKVATVNNSAANSRAMTVHVLGSGMGHNICSPLKRTAVHRRGKRIVNNQWHAMVMSSLCPTLNIKDNQRRVCNSLTKDALGIWPKCCVNLLVSCIWRDKRALHTHLFKGDSKQVKGSAINGGKRNKVISGLSNVKDGKEVCCLTRRSQHCSGTALKSTNL